MKYYILTPGESNELGYYKVSKWQHVDAKVGLLVSGNYAIPETALYGHTTINKIDFQHKIPRPVNPNEWVHHDPGPI